MEREETGPFAEQLKEHESANHKRKVPDAEISFGGGEAFTGPEPLSPNLAQVAGYGYTHGFQRGVPTGGPGAKPSRPARTSWNVGDILREL